MRKRVDDNQAEVVRELRKMGALVAITSNVGDGFPDLVVKIHGKVRLVEVKDGKKPLSAQKLTSAEQEFHALWHPSVVIIRSVDDAIKFANHVVHD